jgi:preprotein translocase subunit YajC
MEHAMMTLPTVVIGLWQDGQSLPNAVPGIGGGGSGAPVEGQPASGPSGTGGGAPVSPFGGPLIWMLVLLMVFMVASTFMSSRKQKRQAAEMLSSLKRGDRVVTAGGMLGTVHEVREDSIVLRVDDVSGAKAHFTRGAIQQVIKSSKSDAKPEGGEAGEAG